MGRCKNLGSLKFSLRYASNYLGAGLSKAQSASSCFFSSWTSHRVHRQWVTAVGCDLTFSITGWWMTLYSLSLQHLLCLCSFPLMPSSMIFTLTSSQAVPSTSNLCSPAVSQPHTASLELAGCDSTLLQNHSELFNHPSLQAQQVLFHLIPHTASGLHSFSVLFNISIVQQSYTIKSYQ